MGEEKITKEGVIGIIEKNYDTLISKLPKLVEGDLKKIWNEKLEERKIEKKNVIDFVVKFDDGDFDKIFNGNNKGGGRKKIGGQGPSDEQLGQVALSLFLGAAITATGYPDTSPYAALAVIFAYSNAVRVVQNILSGRGGRKKSRRKKRKKRKRTRRRRR